MSATETEPEVTNLKIHEMCAGYPRMTPREFEALKLDIRRNGLEEPASVWNDPDGVMWLIDGFNRREAISQLALEGITQAENGKPIVLDLMTLEGTELDLLNHVRSKNGGARRHLKPSQLAAMEVKQDRLARKYAKKAGVTLEKPQGDIAEFLAARSGTNRDYIFTCIKLERHAHDLLDAVASGEMNIAQAKAKLREREAAKRGEVAGDDAPAPTESTEVYDALKNVVTDTSLIKVFAGLQDFKKLKKMIGDATSALEHLAETPAGAFITKELFAEINSQLKSARKTVDGLSPHTTCLVCSGTGKATTGDSKKKCPQCEGKKWVDKNHYNTTPAALREKIDGAAPNE